MNAKPLTIAQAEAVYAVLMDHCAASPALRDEFIRYVTGAGGFYEFRFMGNLGFGGKFNNKTQGAPWYVTCYPGDSTPERREVIANVNALLDEIRGQS